MRTEEILRYEAEFKAMQEELGNFLLVFDFPKGENSLDVPARKLSHLVSVRQGQVKKERYGRLGTLA